MRNYKNCFIMIFITCLAGVAISIHGQISGPDQVLVKTNVSYTHSLSPAAAGYSYLWEADDADIIYQAWDSVVVKWSTSGTFYLELSLLNSSDYSTELLDELSVDVSTPVIEYAYDAAGNRVSRSVIYYSSGSKKSAKSKKSIKTELEKSDQTMVYPNPSDNLIYLKLSNEMFEAGKKQYILYDNLGKIVSLKHITTTLTEIDLSGCKDGIYYLVLIYGNNRKDWKIIKF